MHNFFGRCKTQFLRVNNDGTIRTIAHQSKSHHRLSLSIIADNLAAVNLTRKSVKVSLLNLADKEREIRLVKCKPRCRNAMMFYVRWNVLVMRMS